MSDSAGLAIATRGLVKRFGDFAAVDGLDLAVPEGSVFGFLGPNGSGKTTTIRMLLGLIRPTDGEAEVLGRPMPSDGAAVLAHVAALVEGPAFWPFLSGRENLRRLDAAGRDGDRRTRTARIDAALDRVGLGAAADKRVRAYSLGMKQRLGLAAGLVRPTRLVMLDEPTNGLDPQGTREIRTLVRELAADGTTVFLSSHLLAEVEQICTHAAIVGAGKVLAHGTLAELRARQQAVLRVVTPDAEAACTVLGSCAGLTGAAADPAVAGSVVAHLAEAGADADPAGADAVAEAACVALVQAGVRVRGLTVERPTLEEAFVALTGEGFDVR